MKCNTFKMGHMKEGDLVIINDVEYVAIKAHIGEGFLYFDSKAFHHYVCQKWRDTEENNWIDLILAVNNPKWQEGDFLCVKRGNEDLEKIYEKALSYNEIIIETSYGKMLSIQMEYFGNILIDAESYKYYTHCAFTHSDIGGTSINILHFTDDISEFTLPEELLEPDDYNGYPDIERDFIEQESSPEEPDELLKDWINSLIDSNDEVVAED